MCTALIFPPGVDPRAPHLALPSLAAWLRQHREPVHLFDLNVRAVRYLLQPSVLQLAAADWRRSTGGSTDPTHDAGRLALVASHLVDSATDALAALDCPRRFFDAHAHASARQVIVAALNLSSLAKHPSIAFNIDPAGYEVEGCDPQRLADLVSVSDNDSCNLFADHWRTDFLPELERLNPDLVGITVTNRQQLIPGLLLSRRLKQQGYFTVIGGTVFTKFAEQLTALPEFFHLFADAVIVYEGETALLSLLDQLRNKREFDQVPNLLFEHRGRVIATKTHVEDVNALPTPDFAGLDLSAYLAPLPVLPILTGKGCYFNRCKFCDIPFINHVSKKAYRVRTASRIAADIDLLARRFDCRHFVITDEALSPKLLVQLAAALQTVGRDDLCFTGYARLEPGFTDQACTSLRSMGMKKLYFGLESADQKTLDHMDKGTRIEVAPEVLRRCREAGVNFHLFSIIGFPHETVCSARKTLGFFLDHRQLIDHPGNSFDIHPFGLELRTDYFRDRQALGIAVDDAALNKEFVIGVDSADWNNPSGLDAATVADLIDTEFYPALRRTFNRHHAGAQDLWPGFEEYAGLYAEHYETRSFPYFSAIPQVQLDQQLAFQWNTALGVFVRGDRALLIQAGKFLVIGKTLYDGLDQRRVNRITDQLAAKLISASANEQTLTDYLNQLVASNYLQVRLVDKCD